MKMEEKWKNIRNIQGGFMKKFFKKSLNILMALMTLVNMFIEPICVLASEPVKGDLAYGDQYVRENNGSVNVW